MCPNALKLWFNVRSRQLDARTTIAANEVFTSNRNSERIGFLFGSTGSNIIIKPGPFLSGAPTLTYASASNAQQRLVTIAEFGNLITEPWEFTYPTIGGVVTVWEMFTPAWIVNEILSK